VFAALRVVTARNPVHAALWLVLAFFTAAAHWLMLRAEFLAIALVLVYVGAVMVLFLFVVMMLDVNFDSLRKQFRSYIPVGATVFVLVLIEMALVLLGNRLTGVAGDVAPPPAGGSNTRALGALLYTDYVYPFEIAAVILLVAIIAAIALTHRRRRETHSRRRKSQQEVLRSREQGVAILTAPTLSHYLVLGAILFAISMAGIFLNRKNVIILLMAIEQMLLAVNLNFVAFSSYMQDMAGQVFVFFILTVAAAESAIGLAILVLLFRNVGSIDVEDMNRMKG